MTHDSNKKPFNFRSLLGFILSAFFLWLTIHNSGLKLQNLRLMPSELFYFIVACILLILSVVIASFRFKLFWVRSRRAVNSIYAYDSLVIGHLYNYFLPGNLGDGMRAWHFSRKNKIPFFQSLSAVIAEKWIDAHGFVFLALTLYIVRPFKGQLVSYTIISMAMVIAVLIIVYTIMRHNKYIEKQLAAFTLMFGKAGKIFFRLYWFMAEQISDLVKRKLITRYILFSIAGYTIIALQFVAVLKCAGVAGTFLSVYSLCLISLSMMIIASIPSAPGNIGVLHYGIYSVLLFIAIQYGIKPGPKELLSYGRFAIYLHLSNLIPEVTIGLISLIKERRIIFSI